MLMKKSSPVVVDTNGKGTIIALEKEEGSRGRGAVAATALSMAKKFLKQLLLIMGLQSLRY